VSGAVWAIVAASAPVAAATFTVEPTQIFLSERTSSVLLTLRNDSKETLRFELSAFRWTQSPAGEIQLEPTDEVVFFPALLTLAPGESRRVRVGHATNPDVREKTYRIFVEELPPLTQQTGGIRVLTKMGIPIFLKPAKESATATLTGLGQQDGRLRFTLLNDGTVHFVPKEIRVRGFRDSATAFENRLEGWYVLAGGRRDFEMAFPEADCSRVTSVVVDVQFGSDRLQERLQTPNGVCSR
jgi:fimbrial chaperone protein